MATTQIEGTASFTYTPLNGTSTVHTLAVPLKISPGYGFARTKLRRRWQAYTSDYRTREVYTLTNGADEIVAQIRFDDEPQSLVSMLEEALYNDVQLTYTPNGSDTYTVDVVEIVGGDPNGVTITPDPSPRYGYGEYSVNVRLRLTDGTTWDALLGDA